MESRFKILKIMLIVLMLGQSTTAFAQTGSEKILKLLHILEHESDYKVRIGAAQALSKISDGTVADWMLRAFRHEDNDAVRLSILYSIAEIADQRILPPLIELANQELLSSQERLVIQQILWNYRDIFNTAAWIAEAMDSNDPEMKKVSIWVLGNMGDPNLIPIFQRLLESSNEDVRAQCYESLSKMGHTKALEICRNKQTRETVGQVERAAKVCEQMNTLLIQKKIPRERTLRRKLTVQLEGIEKNTLKPSNYFAYLNKNINQREVDNAISFLKPTHPISGAEKSTKLIEREKISTFQLVVDLVSKYEFDNRDLEILKTIIRENSNSLDHCYLNQLRTEPTLKGDIKTYFKILKSGRVAQIKITDSTMKSKPVESCMMDELKRFEFPSLPIDYVNLIYTFSFTPPQKTQLRIQ